MRRLRLRRALDTRQSGIYTDHAKGILCPWEESKPVSQQTWSPHSPATVIARTGGQSLRPRGRPETVPMPLEQSETPISPWWIQRDSTQGRKSEANRKYLEIPNIIAWSLVLDGNLAAVGFLWLYGLKPPTHKLRSVWQALVSDDSSHGDWEGQTISVKLHLSFPSDGQTYTNSSIWRHNLPSRPKYYTIHLLPSEFGRTMKWPLSFRRNHGTTKTQMK